MGAYTGQDRHLYDRYGLSAIWIEPIHGVFRTSSTNLESYERQRALEYLVTDQDEAEYQFRIANNNGASRRSSTWLITGIFGRTLRSRGRSRCVA